MLELKAPTPAMLELKAPTPAMLKIPITKRNQHAKQRSPRHNS